MHSGLGSQAGTLPLLLWRTCYPLTLSTGISHTPISPVKVFLQQLSLLAIFSISWHGRRGLGMETREGGGRKRGTHGLLWGPHYSPCPASRVCDPVPIIPSSPTFPRALRDEEGVTSEGWERSRTPSPLPRIFPPHLGTPKMLAAFSGLCRKGKLEETRTREQHSTATRAEKNYQSEKVDSQVGFMSKICANSCLATDSYLNTDLWHHKHLTVGGRSHLQSGALQQTWLVWPSSQIMVALRRLPQVQWRA